MEGLRVGLKARVARRMSGASSTLGPRLGWELRRAGARLGWGAGLAVAALLLALATLWLGQQASLRQQQLRDQLRRAKAVAAAPVAGPAEGSAADVARQLSAFYAYLPAHETLPEKVKELIGIAEKNNVTLVKGEYKAQPEENADFLRYQITLPLKADYANIQAFMVAALQSLPTLTLDAVTFKRSQVETGEVEARVQFSLLLKKAAAKRSHP
ncbi:MAG: hypothetical protein V4582_15270 [Pseudomonadota bacterium]